MLVLVDVGQLALVGQLRLVLYTKFFYVKSAQKHLRQHSSRFHVILSAFPDHSRIEQVSDVSCLPRGCREPASDEAPR